MTICKNKPSKALNVKFRIKLIAVLNYNFRFIILFEEHGSYMFEFDQNKLIELFAKNIIPSGQKIISKGRLFRIRGKIYEVHDLAFSFYPEPETLAFDSRLVVEIVQVDDQMGIDKHMDILELPV